MKTLKVISAIFLVLAIAMPVAAQEEMTKDAWQQAMTDLKAKQASLTEEMNKITADMAGLKTQSEKLDADLRACEDALYALLGVTRAEVEAFDKELADMEARVAELQRMSDAQLVGYRDELERMKTRLGEMSQSKICMIPRYGQRVASLTEKVDALLKSIVREKTYTVGTWSEDRDCLWNIAKKRDIYANAWMWPKIWQGNRDKITDPDIIQPRWVLRIPEGKEMTPSERSAANSYYRKKAAAPDGE